MLVVSSNHTTIWLQPQAIMVDEGSFVVVIRGPLVVKHVSYTVADDKKIDSKRFQGRTTVGLNDFPR